MEKVMFSQASVCSQGLPPGGTLPQYRYYGIRSTRRRYASYWNVFLFLMLLLFVTISNFITAVNVYSVMNVQCIL